MSENPKARPNGGDKASARREFLHKAAKYGAVTPAAVTLLLAAPNKRAKAGCTVTKSPPTCRPK